jgi:ferredoxin, 2Fe-2S
MSSNDVAEGLRPTSGAARSAKRSQAQTSDGDVSPADAGDHSGQSPATRQGVTVPRIVFIKPDGERREVVAVAGESVMQAAVNNLVDGIVGECGGDLSCATCHVFVTPEWHDALPETSTEEEDMLEATSEEPTKFSRLSCQIKCDDSLDGLVVRIPATQRF